MSALKQNLNRTTSSRTLATAVACTAVTLLIWILNRSNSIEVPSQLFLPIHTLIEIFSAVVCISIFLISWCTAAESTSKYSLVLGNAFLFVGLVDLMHALTYKGMPPFVFPTSPARPTLYWVIARLANAIALLWAAVSKPSSSPSRLRRTLGTVAAVAAAAATFAVVTWKPHWLPAMYDEQHQRLTTAKVALEYFVIVLHLATIGILLKAKTNHHRERDILLCGLIAFTYSELAFTLYESVYDILNLLGHILKVVACLFVFRAIFVAEVQFPYRHLALERETTSQLQQALFGLTESIPQVDIGTFYLPPTPSARVGGDLYDVFRLQESKIGLVIADVAGKGVKAAMNASMIKHVLRAYARRCESTAEAVSQLNDTALLEMDPSSFVTLFYGVLDLNSGLLRYTNAGHEPPLLLKPTKEALWLETTSGVVGGTPPFLFTEAEITLAPGDELLLYTDGLSEARGKSGFLGPKWIETALKSAPEAPANEKLAHIIELLKRDTGDNIRDDVALLLLKMRRTST